MSNPNNWLIILAGSLLPVSAYSHGFPVEAVGVLIFIFGIGLVMLLLPIILGITIVGSGNRWWFFKISLLTYFFSYGAMYFTGGMYDFGGMYFFGFHIGWAFPLFLTFSLLFVAWYKRNKKEQ